MIGDKREEGGGRGRGVQNIDNGKAGVGNGTARDGAAAREIPEQAAPGAHLSSSQARPLLVHTRIGMCRDMGIDMCKDILTYLKLETLPVKPEIMLTAPQDRLDDLSIKERNY